MLTEGRFFDRTCVRTSNENRQNYQGKDRKARKVNSAVLDRLAAKPKAAAAVLAVAEKGSKSGFRRLGAPTAPMAPRINQPIASGDPIRLEVIPFRP